MWIVKGSSGSLPASSSGSSCAIVDDASISITVSGPQERKRSGKVLAKAFVIRWQGGGKVTLQLLDRQILVTAGEEPSLAGPMARARIKMAVGERDTQLSDSPDSVLGFVRFLLDPVSYRMSAGADDFAQAMMEMQAGAAGVDYRESLLPVLVGPEVSKLLIALHDTGASIDPDRLEDAMTCALAQPLSSARLWHWVESSRARSMVRLLIALHIEASENPESALQRLTGKPNIVERFRVLPAAWVAHIVEYMPDCPQIRRQYFGELLPVLKSLRKALAAQPDCLREKCVRFTAFCCHWIAHFREAGEKLGVGECSVLLTNHLNPRFGESCATEGVDKRYMIRFLKLALDALRGVRSEEAFAELRRSTRRIASWLAGCNARINPELLRQARFERLLEHAELWKIELHCSSSPWEDSLAPLDGTSGAVWAANDARQHRTLLFFPVRSEQELVQAGYRYQNCLREDGRREEYRIDCMRGHTRVFRINSDTGKALALICLDWSREERQWIVGECKGVANTAPAGLGGVIDEFLAHYNQIQPHPHGAVV